MMDRRKWNSFIATLSSEEINSQLADIFAFATEYKSLLEAELGRRYSSGNNQWQDESYTEDQDDSTSEDSIIPSEEHSLQEGVQIEFAVMNKVQRAVAALTVEQLLEEMLNLDNYLGRMLPSQAPLTTISSPPGMTSAMQQRKRAVRFSAGTPSSSARSLRLLRSSLLSPSTAGQSSL